MSQWKVGDGEYIPAHDMDGTTLLAKHSVPHTPTPSLSLYELSGQGHTFVHPTTPWTFDDQRRQKHYSTTNTESVTRSDGTISYQQQIPGSGNKQLWTRQGKSPNKPPSMDYASTSLYSALPTTTDSNNNNNNTINTTTSTNDSDNSNKRNDDTSNISYISSTAPSSSLIHPLTNIYMDLHTDGSSVRIMPSQVIPPVTLPTNQNQDHRVGSQGMVAVDSQQNSMKQESHQYYQQQQQQQHHHHHSQSQNPPIHQQLTPRSEHSHYADDRDNHLHHRRATKHPYSRSFSDTPHSLLPYHHHSSQRHNSIATAEQAAVRAAAVAAAYQSHPMNSSQMTWYPQSSTFQKTSNPIYNNSATSSPRVTPSISKHSNDSEIYQDSNGVADGSTFAPMSDLLSSSRMDTVEYGVHSSTTSTPGTTNTSTHALGPQRHSNQWTSSSSASSPRISDMHPLLSMSFSPNDTYNSKDGCATSLDQQHNDEEKHRSVDFGNGSNSAMMVSSTHTSSSSDASSKKPPPPTTAITKTKAKKSTQRPQKPHTGKRRSPNAFFVFCSERRQILKQGKPNARNTDINRQLGDDWKALTQEKRDWYKEKADRIRAELPNDNTPTLGTSNTPSLMTHTNTGTPPSITFTTTNDGSHSTSDYQNHPHPHHHHHHHHHHHRRPTTFDLPFNDFADANSPASRTNRDSSVAMTIAVDDDSVTSDGTGSGDQHSKQGSLANSDFSSPSSQRPLNVASLSGAAEASALDQATLAGFHSSNGNNTTTNNNNNLATTSEKPERLKRPPNAYLLFNREMRRKLLDQNENLTVALISKLISQSWRDLPQDTKDGYINAAAKLKQQHLEDHPNYVYSRRSRTELAQAGYRSRPSKKRKKMSEEADRLNGDGTATNGNDITTDATGDNTNHINDPEWMSSSSSSPSAITTSTQKDNTKKQRRFPDPRGRKKKKHKNPLGPKHPMSGFLFFASHARPEAVKQHPKSNVGMISKVIAEQWKKMTDQEKQPWVDKAEADKARYAKEMEAFNLAQEQKEMAERQREQQQLTNERMNGHDGGSGYTNDTSIMGHEMKKTSISSLSSGTSTSFKDDQHTSEALSLAAAGGSKESLNIHSRQQQHHRHQHHMDYHHLHHHHHHSHHADIDHHTRQRHNDLHHFSKHSYKSSVSRIHSALASSRPASPTELDSDTIATVAQMVNPQNHAPVPISSGSTSNGASSSTTRDRLHLSSSFHQQQQQHPSSAPSLTSIMHHHDNNSVGNLQLHVPATPPSPAIDTM